MAGSLSSGGCTARIYVLTVEISKNLGIGIERSFIHTKVHKYLAVSSTGLTQVNALTQCNFHLLENTYLGCNWKGLLKTFLVFKD